MRLFGRRLGRHRQADGAVYRARNYVPLVPAQVQGWRFGRTPLGRRGLDPDDVQNFLDRIAVELTDAREAAERARQETRRIKDALRQWQSEQARDRYALYR
ncbi:DivIVA domain-containing protein [Micromonospora sp. NPDC000207]|uniref:DivIVA domain-containing protein n=1 Tax=unclassified Micromonospora TaxID=2617518 RepID=UPI0033269961